MNVMLPFTRPDFGWRSNFEYLKQKEDLSASRFLSVSNTLAEGRSGAAGALCGKGFSRGRAVQHTKQVARVVWIRQKVQSVKQAGG